MTSNILIIGGGIAGPVTAMALREAGIDSTVYEAYDQTADGVGAFLGLAPNGLHALHVLGLDEQVRSAGFDSPDLRVGLTREKSVFETSFAGTRSDALPPITIKRGDLYSVLRDEAVRRGVRIVYGKRLVDASSTDTGVVARFAHGTTAEGDLLIGADGLQSRVRNLIDPTAPAPRYVPFLNTGGFAQGVAVDLPVGTTQMLFGRRAFFGYAPAPDGSVWWFANPAQRKELSRAELDAITSEQWRVRLVELFKDDDPLIGELIRATPVIPPCWATYDFPSAPRWHRGRMLIIGDAAHATSPSAGQGASMALEDAVELARCLRDLPDHTRAFTAYEGFRRERVERIVATGKRNGSQKGLGPIGRALLPLVFKVLPKPRLDWMYDYRSPWSEPVAV
ncbi:FAD-dependent oxidoreductase [Actinokineospora sp.]|uniref:FAD-dependent oxidoreductase n=1 Tax=Actinokineospora sp. TaxID=1872133 RepID=UPI003D6B14FA